MLDTFPDYDFRGGDELRGTPVDHRVGQRYDLLLPYWSQAGEPGAAAVGAARGARRRPPALRDDPAAVAATLRLTGRG